MDNNVEKKLDEILESYHDEMIENLCRIIRIKSVFGPAEADAPYGRGPKDALDFALNLGKEKGFECINYDNHAGELVFGDGEEAAGVISHMDVVPEGDGWTVEPYGGIIKDGNIYGRGAVDDKGCFISAFYACLAIKEAGIPLKRQIRQILGTNEELCEFPCLLYYKEHTKKMPVCGIVPDSWFPVAFAEKGIVNYDFSGSFGEKAAADLPVLKEFRGGSVVNVVIPDAKIVLEATQEQREELKKIAASVVEAERLEFNENGDSLEITIYGKSAHASTPQLGVNAGMLGMNILAAMEFEPAGACHAFRELSVSMGHDNDGEGLGVSYEDETGALTNNIGIMDYQNGELTMGMNLRYPVTQDVDQLQQHLADGAEKAGCACTITTLNPHFYVSPQSDIVKTLVGIYRDMTGDEVSQPVAHGGGSYARKMENFIPFGPSFQDEELMFHKQDEHISCERLLFLSKIYARALVALANQ